MSTPAAEAAEAPLLEVTDWLRDQLDTDERLAHAAQEIFPVPAWAAAPSDLPLHRYQEARDFQRHSLVTDDEHGSVLATTPWHDGQPVLEHAARHDPAHVLATIAAHRALLATLSRQPAQLAEDLVRTLAAAYADRPGYQRTWAP